MLPHSRAHGYLVFLQLHVTKKANSTLGRRSLLAKRDILLPSVLVVTSEISRCSWNSSGQLSKRSFGVGHA